MQFSPNSELQSGNLINPINLLQTSQQLEREHEEDHVPIYRFSANEEKQKGEQQNMVDNRREQKKSDAVVEKISVLVLEDKVPQSKFTYFINSLV